MAYVYCRFCGTNFRRASGRDWHENHSCDKAAAARLTRTGTEVPKRRRLPVIPLNRRVAAKAQGQAVQAATPENTVQALHGFKAVASPVKAELLRTYPELDVNQVNGEITACACFYQGKECADPVLAVKEWFAGKYGQVVAEERD